MVFQSNRLLFREWLPTDIEDMHAINSNLEAMEFFEHPLSKEESTAFIDRQILSMDRFGYCYYAVELKESHQLIGMIGLGRKEFEADFTPCVDVGYRLHPNFWNQGFATEGTIACLEYGFQALELSKIVSICPKINTASWKVMEKAGMQFVQEFEHPQLINTPRLNPCVLYSAH